MSKRVSKLAAVFGLCLLGVPHVLFLFRELYMDERPIIWNAVRFLSHKTLIPLDAKYPTLYSYLATPFVAISGGLRALAEGADSLRVSIGFALVDDMQTLALGPRLLSLGLLLGTVVVARAFLLQRFHPFAAFGGAASLLVSRSLLSYGAYALPDVLVLALSWVSFSMAVVYDERGASPRPVYWASALAGLALSAKYNAVAAIGPIAAVLVSRWLRREDSLGMAGKRAAVAALVYVTAFVAGSPGWLLAPKFFWSELLFEVSHAQQGHLGMEGVAFLGQLELLAKDNPLLVLMATAGAFVCLRTRRRGSLMALASVLTGLVVAAASRKQSINYLYPMVPGLLFFATALLSAGFQRSRWGWVIAPALVLAALGNYREALGILQANTTESARAWLYQHVPAGASIALDWAYVPRLFSEPALQGIEAGNSRDVGRRIVQRLESRHVLYDVSSITYEPSQLSGRQAPDYLITSSMAYDRFFQYGLFTARPASGIDAHEFVKRRRFYEALFASKDWLEVFDADTGNGPQVRVFAHRRPGS